MTITTELFHEVSAMNKKERTINHLLIKLCHATMVGWEMRLVRKTLSAAQSCLSSL